MARQQAPPLAPVSAEAAATDPDESSGSKGTPPKIHDEIIRINTKVRPRALQIALLVPLIAALLGLLNGFRMTRMRDPEPSSAAESVLGG